MMVGMVSSQTRSTMSDRWRLGYKADDDDDEVTRQVRSSWTSAIFHHDLNGYGG